MGCYFNIYSFGSSFQHIFPKSVEYSEKTMKKALKKVKKMESDLGGTEILQPLKHIYSQPCIPNHPRQLFVFTDGKVGNTKEVTDLVKKNADSHRCFSFRIGEGASSALINGMAKEGRGHAQFITGTDRMQPKVMQSLRFALQPGVEDIAVSWDLPKGVSATVLSPPITAIFQGQRSLIYAQLTGPSSEETDGSVTVKYSLAGRPSQKQLHFNLKPAEDSGLAVHRLAARTLIRSMESEERTQRGQRDEEMNKKVVELSVQSGVSSCFTAFIAVNKDSGKAVQGPLVRRNVPTGMYLAYNSPKRMHLAYSSPMMIPLCSGTPRSFKLSLATKKKRGGMFSGIRHMMSPPRSNIAKAIDSCDLDVERSCVKKDAAKPPLSHKDPLLQLVSLQKASGSWILDEALAAVLARASTKEEVEKAKPELVNNEVWASILALIWLHGFKMDAKEEWELLSMKAASWIKAQNAPSVSECVEAGNKLLRCSMTKEAVGL